MISTYRFRPHPDRNPDRIRTDVGQVFSRSSQFMYPIYPCMSVDPGAVRLQGFQGPCLAPAPEGLQAPILLCPCLVLITLFTMIELLFILYISARGTTAMCGIIASLDVEWMIYLNCQTKPSDHQLSEAEAKGPGPGRDGVRGAEQPATTSAEAKVHPSSPLEGGGAKSEL